MPKLNAAFWKWFGDSVVRNEDGSPKVVYHGTEEKFHIFDWTRIGRMTGASGAGFWFSDSKDATGFYGYRTMRVYLKIENPLIVDEDEFIKVAREKYWGPTKWSLKAMSDGHDGLIIKDIVDGDRRSTVFCAFSPYQIKSIKNDGTWDADDPRIGSNPQRHTSSGTSNKQIASVFKAWQLDGGGFHGINLDIGGGKYDEVQAWMSKNGINCVNLVWDKFNRSAEHNDAVLEVVADHGGADSVTIANVLNVIDDKEARRDVLMMAEQYAKIGAPVLISIYEGNKSGIGATPPGRLDDWQNNLRTQAYEHEIASVFGGVFRSGKIFLARAGE